MSTDGYGWTNYETWAVGLWLGNEPETQRDLEHLAAAWDILTRDGGTLSQLADDIERYVEELTEIQQVREHASLASDLLGSSLDRVNWHEIAASYAEEYTDEAEIARRRRVYLDGLRRN